MSDQRADRIAKLEKLRAIGVDGYGSRFVNVTPAGDIRAAAERLSIAPGSISEAPEAQFRSAGRIALSRDTGKLISLTVRDWS
ncbi:MAG: hypothetical protein JNG88_15715, partial [Phycisphaerales bacterium]|nr:hypothetical protein [Phycisphaerales bacterium]